MDPPCSSEERTEVSPVPSTSTTKLCALCPSHSPAKYTCPRCSLQTCSAACSSLHKQQTGCTGERDKVKHVPMKEYGYGALMSDYVYLEDVGRKVKEWGRDIGRGKYQATERDRAVGGRRRKSKKEALQMQLEIRDIPLVLLPPGMERKRLNQSCWDSKLRLSLLFVSHRVLSNVYMHRQKKVYLTIEFVFARGREKTDSIRLMTHKNDIDKPLLALLQTHVDEKLRQASKQGKSKANLKDSIGAESTLEWLRELVFPDPPDQLESFAPPLCLIRSTKPRHSPQRTSSKRSKSRSYHSLDPFQKLSQTLRQKEFVEFPLIEVWEKDAFIDGGFGEPDQHGGWCEKGAEEDDERRRKRRKVEVMGKKQGKAVVKGLLGGYGSSEDEEEENDDQDSPKPLAGLGQYEESENEGEGGPEVSNPDVMDGSEGSGSDDEVANPAVLIQQLKSAGFAFDSAALDDEEVDWGDDDP
jgi:hypothetical protein